MSFFTLTESVLWAAVFSGFVLIIFWFEYRRVRARLLKHEISIKHRMYELAILREIGERIGYSLNVQKIVDIITGSLGKLLPYSTVAYMLPLPEGRLFFHINLSQSVNKDFIAEVRRRMVRAFSALVQKSYTEKDVDESVSGSVTDPSSRARPESSFNVPIVINGKPAGILTVSSAAKGLYKTSEEVDILYTIVSKASEAVSKLQTVLEIEKGKLNAMVASMADGILMVDPQNRLLVINPQTKKLLGLASPSPTIFDVLDALASRLDLRTKIEESLKKDKLIEEEEVEIKRRFVQILITPVKDNKNEPLGSVVLFHDITREKELEKMREDFTSMMVHELRSPLTGIRSIASLLANEKIKTEKEKYREFVELIQSNSSSMLDLVNNLLDVAKLEAGKFEVFARPADLRKLLQLRADSFMSLMQENKISCELKVLPEVPQSVVLDEDKIAQVLNNLLSNAIKFTPSGGKIIISAFTCKKFQDISAAAAERELGWTGLRHGVVCGFDSVVIAVSDTGIGMPEGEVPKLFNKFEQLSSSAKTGKRGTGLGLVIVKGVVEAHGGHVGVLTEEGKGTTFYFSLPLNAPEGRISSASPAKPAKAKI